MIYASAELAMARRALVAANDNHVDDYRDLAVTTFGPLPEEERRGDFMQTYTGRQFWPLDPRPEEVDIRDIAHSLSLQCRFAGHCRRFYSVAEHSTLMARWLRGKHGVEVALWGLLHDASEAYLVDVPRPVKPHLAGYRAAEDSVMRAICERFGLECEMPSEVHDADNRILGDELVNLIPMDWHGQHDKPLGVPIMYWSPAEAEEEFMATFSAFMSQLDRCEEAA